VVFLEKEVVSPLMFSAAVFMCMFSTGLPTPAMRWAFKVFGDELKDGGKREGETPILANGGPLVTQVKAPPSKPVLARLEFMDEAHGVVSITEPRTVIGRHSEANVRVNDIRVSRHHALLVLSDGGKFEIHNQMADRAEPNPILINGEVKEHAVLADGDKVSLGGVAFVFRAAKAA
jgi:hypothetical protein